MDKKTNRVLVLLADDDEDDLILIKEAFDEADFPVDLRSVKDGEELVDYLRHCGESVDSHLERRPDLILLDLNMPRKDGREALQEIKADPRLKCIPVIVLTTSHEQKDIARCYAFGASSFITKPVSFKGLVEAMEALGKYWFETASLPQRDDDECSV